MKEGGPDSCVLDIQFSSVILIELAMKLCFESDFP